MNYLLVGLSILFLVFTGYLIYKFYNKKIKSNPLDFIENKEHHNKKTLNGELYYFYTEWCPHCKTSMPVWDKFSTGYNHEYYKLSFIKVDCDKDEALATKYDIEEYPSVVLVRDGKKYVYDANLEPEILEKFINTIMEL